MVLVHVDEAGQHDASARIDHRIEGIGWRGFGLGSQRRYPRAIDRHESAGEDIACGIDTDHVSIRYQYPRHSVTPAGLFSGRDYEGAL
jgi:hypothetical protein